MATVQAIINAMYVVMYDRTADDTGYDSWLTSTVWGASGISATNAAATQATSAQAQALADLFESTQSTRFTAVYGALTDAAFIEALYMNLGGNFSGVSSADVFYWTGKLTALGSDRGKLVGQFVTEFLDLNLAGSTDTAAVARQNTFINKVLVSQNWVEQSGKAGNSFMNAATTTDAAFLAQQAVLNGVTSTSSSRDAAIDQTDAAAAADSLAGVVGQTETGTTFTLSTASDLINGSSANDTISGAFGTLASTDEVHGSAGTDTLDVRLDTGAGTPSISGVEIIKLNSRNHSATLDFTNIVGATAVSVEGFGLALSAVPAGVPVSVNGGYSSILAVNVSTTATAVTLTLDINSAQSATYLVSGVDALTLNGNGTTNSLGSASDIGAASAVVIGGTGAVSLNLYSGGGGLSADAADSLTAISTTGAGAVTIDAGTAALNLTISGGGGDDSVTFRGNFNNSDSVSLGAGADSVGIQNCAAAEVFVDLVGVETLSLDLNASLTGSMSGVTTASTLNLRMDSAASANVFSSMASGLKTFNVQSAGASSNAVFTYTGGASDVVVNFVGSTATALETAAQTATALTFHSIIMSGNTGSLNLNVNGSASVVATGIVASAVKSVTLSAGTKGITIGTASFHTATALNVVANSGLSVTISALMVGNASATAGGVVAVTLDAAGASALIDVDLLQIDNARALTLNANAAGSGAVMITSNDIVFSATNTASAHGSAFDLTTILINAYGGDIKIGSAHFTASADVNARLAATMTVNLGNTSNDVTIAMLSAANVSATFAINVAGSGTFNLGGAVLGTGALNVSLTGMSTASTASVAATALGGSASLNVTWGGGGGNALGGSGADVFTFGTGLQTAVGNGGIDDYFMSAAAVHTIRVSSATAAGTGTAATALGSDRVFDIKTGDIIVAEAAAGVYTALTASSITTATTATFSAGGIMTASWTAVGTAQLSAAGSITNPFAIFTASGNTIVQVLLMTAASAQNTALSSANFAEFILVSKDLTGAISASFSLNHNGTGLALTLIA